MRIYTWYSNLPINADLLKYSNTWHVWLMLMFFFTGSDVSHSRSVAQMSIDRISKHWTWNDQLCMKCSNLSNYPNSQWDGLLDITQAFCCCKRKQGCFQVQTPTWEPGAPAERIHHLNTNTSFVIISVQLFTLHQITSPSAPLNTPVWNDNVENKYFVTV